MVLEHSDYRAFLKAELANRRKKNSAYSMRALARQLELTQSALSQVLSKKKNLSVSTAARVANRLGLVESEAEYFSLMVQLEATKEPAHREQLQRKIQQLNPQNRAVDLSVELFRLIAEPHHFTILMLTEVDDFDFTPKSIGKRLGIHEYEVEAAITRLLNLELLVEEPDGTGRYMRAKGNLQVRSQIPNQAMRSYHRKILHQAIDSLESHAPKERVMSSEQLAFSPTDYTEAVKLSADFYSRLRALSERRTRAKKTAVYNVGVQIFDLTKGNRK